MTALEKALKILDRKNCYGISCDWESEDYCCPAYGKDGSCYNGTVCQTTRVSEEGLKLCRAYVLKHGKDDKEASIKEGDNIWVSNYSLEECENNRNSRVFIGKDNQGRYLCVQSPSYKDYINGRCYNLHAYLFGMEIPKVKKMTKKEIEDKLGYKIKIVK